MFGLETMEYVLVEVMRDMSLLIPDGKTEIY